MSADLNSARRSPLVVLAYGFRPFFLLAGVWAIVPMLTIGWSVRSGEWPAEAVPLFTWHGHEMLFGFAAAAIAGFLLTAVPSWTGTRPVSGYPLVGLIVLWALGRVESTPLWEPTSLVAQSLSVAFFPALATIVAVPIAAARNFRNLPFLLFLGLLFLADVLFHASRFGWIVAPPFDPLRLAVNTVLLMIVIVGGRIIPAFTRNTFVAIGRSVTIRSTQALDLAAIAATMAVLLGDVVALHTPVTGMLAALAAILLGLRLGWWQGWRTFDIPLLWVLHIGYCWLIAGLALKAAWLLGGYGWAMNWMHAINLGAFGTMILGVTTRAALGHTGRPLTASAPIVLAYLLVSVAGIFRVWGPWLLPSRYWLVLSVSIVAWIVAYALFLLVYVPILVRPRADGKAG